MKSVDIKETSQDKSEMPRLIGLEGKWGSGKSNVIELLEKKLKECSNKNVCYHFFTFDAWAHQEDLQRRAFLGDLTNNLIETKLLNGPTKRKVLQTENNEKDYLLEEDCSWKQRCETLIARKSFTRNRKLPIINNDSKCFALALLLTGIIPSLMNAMKSSSTWHYWWLLVLIASILPIGIFLIKMSIGNKERKTDFRHRWNAMWHFYTASEASETTTMSISEPEPSPTEFKQWMNDVNDSLGCNRLVVVFDNMDRLPSHKIRELWSSINTFFSDVDYLNIWCIIPFDYNRLSKAFETEEVEKLEVKDSLTDKFIKKAFPVVFRVPEPIISDYKKMFDDYAKLAFGDITLDENVSLLYRSKYTTPNPRDIIFFINKLVTLYNQWNKEVKTENMAIYILNEKTILANPEENILNGKYLGDKHLLLTDNDERREEIAMLVYGVGKEWARQLPMKRYVEAAMHKTPEAGELNDIIRNTSESFSILHQIIKTMEVQKDLMGMIRLLDIIDDKDGKLTADWELLTDYFIEYGEPQFKTFLNDILILLKHTRLTRMQAIVIRIYTSMYDNKETVNGGELYDMQKRIDKIAGERGQQISWHEHKVSGEDYVHYIDAAGENYNHFNVYCPEDEVNKRLLESIQGNRDFSEVIKILRGDVRFSFNDLAVDLKELAFGDNTTKKHLSLIFKYLKIAVDGVIDFGGMNMSKLSAIFKTMTPEDDAYIDVAVVLCVNGQQVTAIAEDALQGKEDDIYRYTTTEKLWNLSAKSPIVPGVKSLMTYCIKSKKTYGEPPKDDVLSKMNTVKNHTGATYQQMIEFVNEWGYVNFGTNDKDASKLKERFNIADWATAFGDIENSFTNSVLNLYKRKLPSLNNEDFKHTVNGRTNYGGYWATAVESLEKRQMLDDDLSTNLHGIANYIVSNLLKPTGNVNLSNFEKILLRRIKYSELTQANQTELKSFITTDNKFNVSKYKLLQYIVEKMEDKDFDSSEENFVSCLDKNEDNVDMKAIIKGNPSFYKPLIDTYSKKGSKLRTLFKDNES